MGAAASAQAAGGGALLASPKSAAARSGSSQEAQEAGRGRRLFDIVPGATASPPPALNVGYSPFGTTAGVDCPGNDLGASPTLFLPANGGAGSCSAFCASQFRAVGFVHLLSNRMDITGLIVVSPAGTCLCKSALAQPLLPGAPIPGLQCYTINYPLPLPPPPPFPPPLPPAPPQAAECAVATLAVACYDAAMVSGNKLVDLSTGGNDLVFYGGVQPSPIVWGAASGLRFNGQTSFLRLGRGATLAVTPSFTIAMWVFPFDAVASQVRGLASMPHPLLSWCLGPAVAAPLPEADACPLAARRCY